MVDQTANQGSIGAGQQEPIDSNSEFWVISFIVKQMMAQLETMIPVQVSAVHAGQGSPPAAGTVDVQLLVSTIDGQGNATQPGIVYGLPYFRAQGGPWAIILDPGENDFGWIIGASRDISNVVKNPGIQVPGSSRKYSYSDGIYVGGCLNDVPAATLWLKSDGTWVLTDKPGNVLEGTNSGITATPVSGGFFNVNGTIKATGDVIGNSGTSQVSLVNHLTSGVTTGSGESGPPVPGT